MMHYSIYNAGITLMLLGLAEFATAGGLSNAANLELLLTPPSLATTIVNSVFN